MVYCAAASGLGPFATQDITFPNQIEVKVNGDDVKSNFKGLKNKPGTTKPADITDLVRKTPGYNNSLQITYALTTKVGHNTESHKNTPLKFSQKYTIVVNLVQKTSADALAESVKSGKSISRDNVINESKI